VVPTAIVRLDGLNIPLNPMFIVGRFIVDDMDGVVAKVVTTVVGARVAAEVIGELVRAFVDEIAIDADAFVLVAADEVMAVVV
jgi:hypothetical protein